MGALHCVTDNHMHIYTARASGEIKDMRHPLRLRTTTPSSHTILHSTLPATQRASLSRSGELTVASFIKIIDSGSHSPQCAECDRAGGGGRGGVQPRHKIARTRKVLSEECKTGITELAVKQACSPSFFLLYIQCTPYSAWPLG